MPTEILVALITLTGSALGTFSGICVNARMTNYRLQQLEKKVDKHNHFAERIPVIEEKIAVANNRIGDLEVVVGMNKPKI